MTLNPEQRAAIACLRLQAWPSRRIAKALGVNRNTVDGYVQRLDEPLPNIKTPRQLGLNPRALKHGLDQFQKSLNAQEVKRSKPGLFSLNDYCALDTGEDLSAEMIQCLADDKNRTENDLNSRQDNTISDSETGLSNDEEAILKDFVKAHFKKGEGTISLKLLCNLLNRELDFGMELFTEGRLTEIFAVKGFCVKDGKIFGLVPKVSPTPKLKPQPVPKDEFMQAFKDAEKAYIREKLIEEARQMSTY